MPLLPRSWRTRTSSIHHIQVSSQVFSSPQSGHATDILRSISSRSCDLRPQEQRLRSQLPCYQGLKISRKAAQHLRKETISGQTRPAAKGSLKASEDLDIVRSAVDALPTSRAHARRRKQVPRGFLRVRRGRSRRRSSRNGFVHGWLRMGTVSCEPIPGGALVAGEAWHSRSGLPNP
jgi:hypothetical protein